MKQIIDFEQAKALCDAGIRIEQKCITSGSKQCCPTVGELIEWIKARTYCGTRIEVSTNGNCQLLVFNHDADVIHEVYAEELIDALVELCLKIKAEQGR